MNSLLIEQRSKITRIGSILCKLIYTMHVYQLIYQLK